MIPRIVSVVVIVLLAASPLMAQAAAITVRADESLGTIDPLIFGHFTEETLSSYEGGICSEMLFNRKFEMPEDRTIANILVRGVSSGWEPIEVDTSVTLVLDRRVYYSPSQSQRITRGATSVPAGVQQQGWRYIMPHLAANQRLADPIVVRPGQRYRVRLAVKNQDLAGPVHVALGESWRKPAAHQALTLAGGYQWRVYQCELAPAVEAANAKFMVYIDTPGTIWLDSVSMVRVDLDEDGFRRDALELTRRLKPTCLRWPGGWFVSDYDWRNGIGPVDQRPAELNRAWIAYYCNDVGIDEFVGLCRKLQAEPYVCVNVGTGTAADAAALVEYANGGPETTWGKRRAANGHRDPYHIRLWNVGNEEYLPTLGATRGSLYGRRFLEFAAAMKAVDPSIQLVAVGAFDLPAARIGRTQPFYPVVRYLLDWNAEVLPLAGTAMDAYSIHHYAPDQDVKGCSTCEILQAALVSAEHLDGKLNVLNQQMDRFCPGHKRFPIALDEWAVWLPKGTPDLGPVPPASMSSPNDLGLYGSGLSLRDALTEAPIYNLMQRRPGEFLLANRTLLYAYAMGMVGIGREKVVASPSALMVELYATSERCKAVRVEGQGPTFDVPQHGGFLGARGAACLDCSARLRPGGKILELFVVNRDLESDIQATIEVRGAAVTGKAQAAVLHAASIREWNTFESPDRVKIVTSDLTVEGGGVRSRFAAHSITRITVSLR